MDLRFAVFILTRIIRILLIAREPPTRKQFDSCFFNTPTWRFYPAKLVRLERFVLKETRIELPPTWRFYPARLGKLERFVFKETTHTAVPHVDLQSRTALVVTISGNAKVPHLAWCEQGVLLGLNLFSTIVPH